MSEYNEKLKEFYSNFGFAKKMVLATCKDERVTARTMSVILINEIFYFQTDKTSIKYEQIAANPLVALCLDNMQIEGVATVLGHPLHDDNNLFAITFENSYKGSFDAYSSLNNEVLIEVKPNKITLWEYESGKPYRVFFDIQGQTYSKEFYIGE